jgi:carboxyl-terminal processing protease
MKSLRIYVFLLSLFAVQIVFGQVFNESTYKFSKTMDWLNNYYVDSVNDDKLTETAIISMLQELDPHSTYVTKEEAKEMNESLEGNFEGIGVSFNILYDTIFIVSPIPGGPSERLGIEAGDRIIKIDGENVAGVGINNTEVFKRLRGAKGTKVNVSILRKGVKDLLDFTIVRDKIPIFSIDASYMIDEATGYIKINRFAATTIEEFEAALQELKKQNLQNLIVDLSDNGGGILDAAVKLSDCFLDSSKLIVYTEGLHVPKIEYNASTKGSFQKGKLVVILNEGSASASEIFAGAIQDWDRGVIVGRRSFGKGLVQRPLNFQDGSLIRLTIARYYTPTGRSIQKPYDEGSEEYYKDLSKRYEHGEFLSADSIKFPDSLKYQTLISKRTVYGGGGIMPDYFIPLDTTFYTDYYGNLLRKGIFNRYILNYIDVNRKELQKKYPTFKLFNEKFEVSNEFFEEFISFAEKEGLPTNRDEFEISKEQIQNQMKGYIARDLWTTSEYYQVVNSLNPSFTKALEILKSDNLYAERLKQ